MLINLIYSVRLRPKWDRSTSYFPSPAAGIMRTANNFAFDKKNFLSYELGLLTMKAALSTRDSAWPIYCKSKKTHQRTPVQNAIRKTLRDIEI